MWKFLSLLLMLMILGNSTFKEITEKKERKHLSFQSSDYILPTFKHQIKVYDVNQMSSTSDPFGQWKILKYLSIMFIPDSLLVCLLSDGNFKAKTKNKWNES